jgi:hypothetical protein
MIDWTGPIAMYREEAMDEDVKPPQIVRCRSCKEQCSAVLVKRNTAKGVYGKWEYSCIACTDGDVQHRSESIKVK